MISWSSNYFYFDCILFVVPQMYLHEALVNCCCPLDGSNFTLHIFTFSIELSSSVFRYSKQIFQPDWKAFFLCHDLWTALKKNKFCHYSGGKKTVTDLSGFDQLDVKENACS